MRSALRFSASHTLAARMALPSKLGLGSRRRFCMPTDVLRVAGRSEEGGWPGPNPWLSLRCRPLSRTRRMFAPSRAAYRAEVCFTSAHSRDLLVQAVDATADSKRTSQIASVAQMSAVPKTREKRMATVLQPFMISSIKYLDVGEDEARQVLVTHIAVSWLTRPFVACGTHAA